MPRINQGELILQGALDDLKRDWQIAAAGWHDKAREDFQREFMDEFLPAGGAAVRAMTELTLLMRRVVRECQ
ncbi:MAG: hypothetical protein ABFS86_09515 [Planctomycetota bacterium]